MGQSLLRWVFLAATRSGRLRSSYTVPSVSVSVVRLAQRTSKSSTPAEPGHHIYPDVGSFGMMAAKMNGMTALEVVEGQWRNRDRLGLKIAQGRLQPRQIAGVGQDQQVGVTAKLRCAVEHARLAAHQQGTDPAAGHRRKDFPYPARDQANLRSADNAPTARHWRASVAGA
jgi:hypothetical protein